MIGINSNINSLVAQQNLNNTQSALSSAITRLSSGKRINSAADDAAGQAIASRMTAQINGLNQGVSNANDGVSMTQTASSGLSQITDNLQRIRQLAVQASTGSLSSTDQAALQQEVTQRIAEVNRIASQTTYNGTNVLDGSAGVKTFQIGANVGQSISVDLSQGVSAAQLGTGVVSKGSTLGTLTNLALDSSGNAVSGNAKASITSINVLADGQGGFTFTDQNNQALSGTAVSNLFGSATTGSGTALTLSPQGALTTADKTAGDTKISSISSTNVALTSGYPAAPTTATYATASLGTIANVSLNADGTAYTGSGTAAITSIEVYGDGSGGYTFGINGADPTTAAGTLSASTASSLFTVGTETSTGKSLSFNSTGALSTAAGFADTTANTTAAATGLSQAVANNKPTTVSNIDISTTGGANLAIESIDNALNAVNGIQAALGAAQNRFSSISSTQTAQSTNLSSAQSQITDANFAQETANLSKAQVLQQAGISVLAQANSLPQQVLKLLG
ncbi:flagellin [Caballeronia sp. AZ7_KS35]|uniref:flagellin N-terminal helical domain-containing protein n=1 Tax=Caballeronia sp. AZ7_KS35 TaxID=2921762 RepID=UPI002027CC51|nr:flagellin [Caballeronia sp. AZ7_KS35]